MTKAMAEKKNELITRAEELVDTAKAEERALTDDEATEIEQIRDQVLSINKSSELEEQIRELDKNSKGDEKKMEEKKTREIQETEAFEAYLRGNLRAELTPAANSGGALIPTTVLDRVFAKVYDISPVLANSTKFNVKGNLAVPVYPSDSANITVAYANEFTDLESTTGKFSAVQLNGFLAGAMTKISRTLINSTEFDIVGFIVDRMAYEIAHWLEGEIFNGTTNKIVGLSGLTNKVTTASTSAIVANELIDLVSKVKDRYQANAAWYMSPATRAALWKLQDGEYRWIFNYDASNGFRPTILGKPVYVSDAINDIAAGKDVIFYGDMSGLATKFSEEASVEVLRERYAPAHAVAVVGWVEADAAVINEQAIAKLTMKAS